MWDCVTHCFEIRTDTISPHFSVISTKLTFEWYVMYQMIKCGKKSTLYIGNVTGSLFWIIAQTFVVVIVFVLITLSASLLYVVINKCTPSNCMWIVFRTYSDFHVDFNSFALFESKIKFLFWSCLFLVDFFLVFHPFEMVLECNIQIEGIGPVAKSKSQKCCPT